MAFPSRLLPWLAATIFFFIAQCQAKTVTYDWNVTWVTANPDGLADRQVVGINNQWPLPIIEVDKGDRLVVNMHNGLGDKSASIHFHGMYQTNTTEMDGPSMLTQCPVPPGSSITYNFTVNQNGTYWYHCHTDYCYPDGYRQALIVHDNSSYFADKYDEDLTITMTDWYHELTETIAPTFITVDNPTGAEPIPDSFLFNDTLNTKIPVEAGKTYLFRLINIGAFVAQYFYIEDHTMRIVEVDGIYTDEAEADILYISAAQRYTVLVTMKNSTEKNYPIVMVADSQLLDTIPSDLQLNQTNWLEYNSSAAFEQAVMTVSDCSDLNPYDDMGLVPHDRMALLENPDISLDLTVTMQVLDDGADYAFLNDISYTAPKVPALYTVMSAGDQATDATVYGDYTHSVVLEKDQIVEIILNNGDTGTHPFHLHGHAFQMIDRYPPYGPHFYDYADGDPITYNASNHTAFPEYPPRRDTFVLPPQGYFVVRFKADNPGVWFFHCHIDWHLAQGLAMVFIEAPLAIQSSVTIPQQHYEVCEAAGIATAGNAAGNTEDYTDLTGQNKQVAWLPGGFTARGIVALVFSCVSAFLGMGMIAFYGLSDIKKGGGQVQTRREEVREHED
ncbi:ferroxidase fet3 [Aspergillus tubingensis]|uniref:Ferro-O2-oxidoreductase n=2 Tax=Aspergillus subgen. Circumdati TaxID=2720871 RepID=A0A100I3W9_ASPNG|nr:ferro-O2-oxidoreductase [Aspergillus vadensis CBS 113365]GAQ34224.1 ferro-O2-oxidoreductase [Aspergillus niger]GLA68811.1 ferroxidase fet3 [Aspergillus tubingensis]PYH74283.1 ferro-O2-oxidoreductase [Aspergillus vadensis CBS 113365]GLA97500.1 ferroxidase fet3 [Aspergillus tubingensis]GLB15455.1 ferroxidase fet3 [Aspergillus tubingensis]